MFRPFFKMTGALVLWAFKGFKGKYEDYLGDVTDHSTSVYGMIFFVVAVIIMISIARLF